MRTTTSGLFTTEVVASADGIVITLERETDAYRLALSTDDAEKLAALIVRAVAGSKAMQAPS